MRSSRRRCCCAVGTSRPWPRGEPVGDGGAVLDGLVVVVLELGLYVDDFQAQTADAGQHPAVGRLVGGEPGVVAVGLEVGELTAQQLGLGLGIVDEMGPAGELDGRVVAGGDTVGGRGADARAPGPRDEGVVAEDGEQDVRVVLDRLPDRVGPGEVDQQVVAAVGEVAGEMGGYGDGRVTGRAVDGQLSEIVAIGDPGPPFRYVEAGIPGLDEHAGLPIPRYRLLSLERPNRTTQRPASVNRTTARCTAVVNAEVEAEGQNRD